MIGHEFTVEFSEKLLLYLLRRWEGCKRQRGCMTPGEQVPLNEYEQSSYELMETEAACTGMHKSVLELLGVYYGFQISVLTPENVNE